MFLLSSILFFHILNYVWFHDHIIFYVMDEETIIAWSLYIFSLLIVCNIYTLDNEFLYIAWAIYQVFRITLSFIFIWSIN